MATSGNDTCFSDAVAFQGLETLGLHYVEEQSLAHQVCLRSIFMSADWFWEELSSAVCSGPPELPFVSERSGRARFFNKKKEVVASWEEKRSSCSRWRIRSED